ncbi:hypothetical protein [Mesorhizobium sp. M0060]|uniref:hypothetical protein n=1 Tax=Mesorhizobium sp. M0060 TaxID=2956866 RepID=UPI003339A8FD
MLKSMNESATTAAIGTNVARHRNPIAGVTSVEDALSREYAMGPFLLDVYAHVESLVWLALAS